MRRRLLGWAVNRMVTNVIESNLNAYGTPSGWYNLNPEDWDEVAYLMLCGLTGRKL